MLFYFLVWFTADVLQNKNIYEIIFPIELISLSV